MKVFSTKLGQEEVGFTSGGSSSAVRSIAVTLALSYALLSFMVTGVSSAGSRAPAPTTPISLSLLPSGDGWILSFYHCSGVICLSVEHTSDVGQTWASVPLPAQLTKLMGTTVSPYYPNGQLSIYFANAKSGWIYGSAPSTSANSAPDVELWSTHDGGQTWSQLPAPSLGMKFGVVSVRASRGQVYAIGWTTDQSFGLWRSPVGTNSWRRVSTPALYAAAGGTTMEGSLVFKGTGGWLMVGNDRGVTGSARLTTSGQWVKWTSPCASVGGDLAAPVAYSATTLIDVCTIGGYGGSIAPGTPRNVKLGADWTFTSPDGGRTFAPSMRIGVDNTSQWLEHVPGLPASPSPGVILIAKSFEKGPTATEHLLSSRNSGKTWTSVYSPNSTLMGALQLVTFASPSLGAAIVQVNSSSSFIIISTNGGKTWKRSHV